MRGGVQYPTFLMPFVALTVLALIGLLFAQFFNQRLAIWIAKPLASAGFVGVGIAAGGLGLVAQGDLYAAGLLAGLVLSWWGDVLLIPQDRPLVFRAGIFAFLLGHVAYVLAFASLGLDLAAAGLAALVLLVIAIGVLRRLGPVVPRALLFPVRAYVLVISAMLLCAVGAVAEGGNPGIALGAAMFYFSDLAVARDRFIAPGFVNAAWGLPLYYGGQLVLAGTLG